MKPRPESQMLAERQETLNISDLSAGRRAEDEMMRDGKQALRTGQVAGTPDGSWWDGRC